MIRSRAVRPWARWLPVLALCVGCSETPSAASARSSAAPAPALVDGHFTPAEVRQFVKMRAPSQPPRDSTNEVSGDERAQRMGKALFFDKRLSEHAEVSCASCHDPSHGFSVPERLGQGLEPTPRHPPTLLNAAYQRFYDWDGKADSLWMQAMRPIESAAEQGFGRTRLVRLLQTDPELRAAYVELFGDFPEALQDTSALPERARPMEGDEAHPDALAWATLREEQRAAIDVVFVRALKAIAAYEERLVSLEAPLDRYIDGLTGEDPTGLGALTESQKRGLKVFVGAGRCVVCHNGPMLSDMTFHNLGLGHRDGLTPGDEGRWSGIRELKDSAFNALGPHSAERTGDRAQWVKFLKRTPENHGQFRTPSLRNITRTPPYMHGGHFDTLEEVLVFYMSLGEQVEAGHREDSLVRADLSPQDREDLLAFFKALEGAPLEAQWTTE
ncbi:MAG: cytochrome c peroxidase [Myxococcota bacterium]